MTRRRLVIAIALWVLLSLELVRSNAQPAFLVLAAIMALVATALSLAFDLAKDIVAADWPTPGGQPPVDTSLQKRADTLRALASGAAGGYTTTLHDSLVDLVDDRLLANHGIDRRTNPQGAELILPDSLLRLIDGPDRSTSSANQLSRLLNDIEEL